MNEGKNDDFIYEHGMKEAIMRLEERVCNLDDPEPVIKAILQTLSEYYGAEKAYIIEKISRQGMAQVHMSGVQKV